MTIASTSAASKVPPTATYWLSVLPGWYSWRMLQRLGYL